MPDERMLEREFQEKIYNNREIQENIINALEIEEHN